MSCESFNVIYVLICSGCLEEYLGETSMGKTKLSDLVRVYRQHIKQPEYQQLKVEEHVGVCSRGAFKILPFLQMHSNNIDLRRASEPKFQEEFKIILNKLEKSEICSISFFC